MTEAGALTLLPQHARLIDASAISPEIAAARGYRSVEDTAELARLGFKSTQQRVPALLVPVWNVAGEIATHQLRPDVPRIDAKGKALKYETPAGSRMVLDVPPAVHAKLGDPKTPLLFTEGVRKADAAVSKGLACVALLGVWNWRGKNVQGGSTVLADFEAIALKGRDCFVVFDSDAATKPAVKGALLRFRAFLESRGAKAKILHLPVEKDGEKVGLDDYLAAGHAVDELLALTKAPRASGTVASPDRPTIRVSPEIKLMVDAAEDALLRSKLEVYARGGELVRIRHGASRPTVEPLPQPSLNEALSVAATWIGRSRASGDDVQVPPPRSVVDALAVRGTYRLQELADVVERPALRPDGTVLDQPGYDAASKLYLKPSAEFPVVKERPSYVDALAALGQLREVFCDFPFVAECDRSAALALVLTLLGREAIEGPCPLFTVRAPERGAGKSLLVDAACVIATGIDPTPRVTQASDRDEERKEILALGREGSSVVMIDNVAAPLGSDVLAAALTARTFKGRVLGVSQMLEVRVPVFTATGCNLQVKGDVGRRTIPIDLDPKVERPEEREGFRHADLIAWVKRERPRLVAAGLTVLRWYFTEGCPRPEGLAPFGSFEAWSNLVRSVLVWLGEADPCEGRERIREDSDHELEAHRVLLDLWSRELGDREVTIAEVVHMAASSSDFKHALAALDSKLDPERLDQRRLSYAFRRLRGRIVNGFKLERVGREKGGRQWRVVSITISNAYRHPIDTAIDTPELAEEKQDRANGVDGVDTSGPLTRTRARAREQYIGGRSDRSTPSTPEAPTADQSERLRGVDQGVDHGVDPDQAPRSTPELPAIEDEPIVTFAQHLFDGVPVPAAAVGPLSMPRWGFVDGDALRAQGWTGPGPFEACLVCKQGTAWIDPGGRPRHSRCDLEHALAVDPDLDGGGSNHEDDYLPLEARGL